MSNVLSSSFHLQSSGGSVDQTHVILPASQVSTVNNMAGSVGSSWAGPSTWRTTCDNLSLATSAAASQLEDEKLRSVEEQEITERTHARVASRLASDHTSVLYADTDTPFRDTADAVNRLLPYHIFQQPKDDLHFVIKGGKGKGKETEQHLHQEIRETKFALECHQRRHALEAKFREISTRSGKRSALDEQAVLIASLVLDSERSDMTVLNNELRTARAELERKEREKRAALHTARAGYYGSVPAGTAASVQAQYYRQYPYAYTQVYGTPMQSSSTSTFSVSTTSPSTNYASTQAAIPVQLPVASLPALHALGIIPVPASSLPPDGQSPPPAVLRGSTSNGTMLSLEINVSLLQQAQMSGLAMVLNSLMSRNSFGSTSDSSATTSTPSNPTT